MTSSLAPGCDREDSEGLAPPHAAADAAAAAVCLASEGEALAPELAPAAASGAPVPMAAVPRHVARNLLSGTSAMGAGALIERGLGFLANILAARLGGASTFGAYSLGITTAANISTYAAGGIGSTAARFSGKYPLGSAGYPRLARALAVVSLVSAAVAAAALWLGAAPLAHILKKESLAPLLRWAAFSAAGMIVLECARGFFIGQRRLVALLLLSLLVGAGMVVCVPLAARHHHPSQMILSQAGVAVAAVLVCVALARPLGMLVRSSGAHGGGPSDSSRSILREVWGFGMVQLAGLVGMNLAGWWLTTLVARADTTLVQMSFFAIANQMRNIVGLGPSLLTESSYAIMAASHRAEPLTAETQATEAQYVAQLSGQAPAQAAQPLPDQTPDRVMALCTFLATASAFLLSAAGILIAPWGMTLLYGHAYRAGAITTAIGLAIAIVHMGNAPAAARLTIVSIRSAAWINTAWALVVASAGTLLLLRGGTAWQAMGVYLGAHLLSSALVVTTLARHGSAPAGMRTVLLLGAATSVALAVLAALRDLHPQLLLASDLAMLGIIAAAFCALVVLGRRHGWLPNRAALRALGRALRARLPGGLRTEGGAL